MKTIELDAKVNFHAIEVKDAVVMSSTMDNIKSAVEQKRRADLYNSLPEEERSKYITEYYSSAYIDRTEEVYDVLCKLGFVCSDGDNTIKETSINDLRLNKQ